MTKKTRHFLSVSDLSAMEIRKIINRSVYYKKNRYHSKNKNILKGRVYGLVFEKPSTRTRISFEVGIRELGGDSLFLARHNMQLGRGETLLDTLLFMERCFSGIIIRNHDHDTLLEVSSRIKIPLINGLSNRHHPAQAIADALTIIEKVNKTSPRLVYLGEGNNVSVSLIEICSLLKWPLKVASPPGYGCTSSLLKDAVLDEKYIFFTEDPEEAVRDADVIYTDTWFSMNDEEKEKENSSKEKDFLPYQVNDKLLHGLPNCIFLHCLPAYRGKEVTEGIIDGPRSVVWDQAENRLHAQKGVMEFLFT